MAERKTMAQLLGDGLDSKWEIIYYILYYNLFHHLQQHHKVQYEECVKLCAVAQTVQYFQSPAPIQTTLKTNIPVL